MELRTSLRATTGPDERGDVVTKKYNYIYKITNTVNNKIYVGVHSTNDLEDGYMGNGIKRMSDAVRKSKKSRFANIAHAYVKYGMDNFKKDILFLYDTKEEAYEAEAFIVDFDFVKRRDTYNLKEGGIVPPNAKGIKRTDKFKKQKSKDIYKHMNKLVEKSVKEYVFVDLNTNIEYFCKNLAKFSRKMNLNEQDLRSVACGRIEKTSANWWGCKLEDWKGKPIFKKRKIPRKRSGILYHKDGRVVKFNDLKEASEKTGADKSVISKVLRGIFNQTKGWSCKKW